MKNWLLIGLALVGLSCDQDPAEEPIRTSFSDRQTLQTIPLQDAWLTSFCGDTSFLYVRLQDAANATELVVDDSTLWHFLDNISSLGSLNETGNSTECLPAFHNLVEGLQTGELEVRVSGFIKESLEEDTRVAGFDYLPFDVSGLEKVHSCRVKIAPLAVDPVRLQSTSWRIAGLLSVNQTDTIFPPCEYDRQMIRFTEDEVDSGQTDVPPSYRLEIETGANPCTLSYSVVASNSFVVRGVCSLEVPYSTADVVGFHEKVMEVMGLDSEATYQIEGNVLSITSGRSSYRVICVAEEEGS